MKSEVIIRSEQSGQRPHHAYHFVLVSEQLMVVLLRRCVPHGAAAVEPGEARAPPVARGDPPRAAHARASRTALHEAVNISVVE